MKKVVRDGKVAVLYSPGYGAGWHTWGAPVEMVFDPEIVKMVEEERFDDIEAYVESLGLDFYTGGSHDLKIKWIPEGTQFKINEYDGSESIEILGQIDFLTA
jgi:hypothetical protein